MTVKELIARLSELRGDLLVVDEFEGVCYEATDVRVEKHLDVKMQNGRRRFVDAVIID